jgi:hypothetical protein
MKKIIKYRPASVCPPAEYTSSLFRFNKSALRTVEEHVINFIPSDAVLHSQLLYYVRKPDETIDLQGMAPSDTACQLLFRTVSRWPASTTGVNMMPL